MKRMIILGLGILPFLSAGAQQKSGKVIYQRTSQMQIRMAGDESDRVHTRTDKFEMNFADDRMIFQSVEDDLPDDNAGPGGGIQIRTVGGGLDDATYCDFSAAKKIEQREFFDKKFLITDSIRRGNWKLTEETKTILGFTCRKATSQRVGKRMMMTMDNGNMQRKEIEDTTSIVAWFTMDIPVPAGPEVAGQLPGLILSLETNNGRSVYTAIEVSQKADIAAIKPPSKGKKVTPEEFNTERNKLLEQMQKNQGGNIRIRM
jgi:GLPGLI family protein